MQRKAAIKQIEYGKSMFIMVLSSITLIVMLISNTSAMIIHNSSKDQATIILSMSLMFGGIEILIGGLICGLDFFKIQKKYHNDYAHQFSKKLDLVTFVVISINMVFTFISYFVIIKL